MAIQILEKHVIADKTFFKARILLIGLRLKTNKDYWLSRATIDEWSRSASSSVHYVFVKM